MSTSPKQLPQEVRALRRVAYREVLAVGSALGITAYHVHRPLTLAGEALGLGYVAQDYKKLEKQLANFLDRRYFQLVSAQTEVEYPYSQLRICVNGSTMEREATVEYAMHQGVYINLYLLAVPAFLAGLQERSYCAVQEKITDLLQGRSAGGLDDELLAKYLRKRSDIMNEGLDSGSKVKYYQIFPFYTADYKLARIQANALEKALEEPEEDLQSDWSGFEFDVPEDLVRHFDLLEDKRGLNR